MRYLTPLLLAPVLASAAPTQDEFYVREEFPLPPGEVMEGGSIAIMDDRRVALSTRRGDLWICDGAFGDVTDAKWTKFATGLHEPLGMAYRDGWILLTSGRWVR